jgi:hypothetical protein
MSSYLFGSSKTEAETATENVRAYRAERLRRLGAAKTWLTGQSSPVLKAVTEASKAGELKARVDLRTLDYGAADKYIAAERKETTNEDGEVTVTLYKFTVGELDQLVVAVTESVEGQGFSHSVSGHEVTVTWEDPAEVDRRKEEEAKKAEEEAKKAKEFEEAAEE